MLTIRPHQIFGQVADDRVAKVMLPRHRGAAGTTMLETALLLAAAKIVNAKRIFEFGTFRGSTAYNFALNLPEDGRVFTLDLEDVSVVTDPADIEFAETHLKSPMDFTGTPEESKIVQLKGNSRELDCMLWQNSMDLTFIDGGHDLATVQHDTWSAFVMRRHSDPSCIAWHDYLNPRYPELTRFLNCTSRDWPMVHVEDTMLCFWFSDNHK